MAGPGSSPGQAVARASRVERQRLAGVSAQIKQ